MFRHALAIGCVLAFFAWAAGYFKTGNDGPCTVLEWSPGTQLRQEDRLMPLSQRCVAVYRDGTRASTPWYPEDADYLLATGLFLLPLAVCGGIACRSWPPRSRRLTDRG